MVLKQGNTFPIRSISSGDESKRTEATSNLSDSDDDSGIIKFKVAPSRQNSSPSTVVEVLEDDDSSIQAVENLGYEPMEDLGYEPMGMDGEPVTREVRPRRSSISSRTPRNRRVERRSSIDAPLERRGSLTRTYGFVVEHKSDDEGYVPNPRMSRRASTGSYSKATIAANEKDSKPTTRTRRPKTEMSVSDSIASSSHRPRRRASISYSVTTSEETAPARPRRQQRRSSMSAMQKKVKATESLLSTMENRLIQMDKMLEETEGRMRRNSCGGIQPLVRLPSGIKDTPPQSPQRRSDSFYQRGTTTGYTPLSPIRSKHPFFA